MDVCITPSPLSGELPAIPSKSYAHRYLIAAALCDGPTVLQVGPLSEDINATMDCLRALGADIRQEGDTLTVSPLHARPGAMLDCAESGSTARFLLPVAACVLEHFTLTGRGRLPSRPFSPICAEMARHGCTFDQDTLPMQVRGTLRPGLFRLPGDVSSQFVSGLLFALPLLPGDSRIVLTTPLQSAGYVDMTLEALSAFGISVEEQDGEYFIPGSQRYQTPGHYRVEGDWSNAAFFLSVSALGGQVSVLGLNPESKQGDAKIVSLLRRFGQPLVGYAIDATQIPDLVPVLATVAAVARGETVIYGAQRLRIKESDRLEATCQMLTALGADIEVTEDGLRIQGKPKLRGGTVDGCGDHRIVMSAAVAATVCEAPVWIRGAGAVNKSYPMFFDHYRQLGGKVDVLVSG